MESALSRGIAGSNPARAAKFKKMIWPVIFLDFDGVLNTEQYQTQLAIFTSQHDYNIETNPIIGITEHDTYCAINILTDITK